MAKVEIKFESCKQFAECLDFLRKMVAIGKKRSCYDRAINTNCLELVENLQERLEWLISCNASEFVISEDILLNGASDWNQFVGGGCSLFIDSDIAARYCTPGEYKKHEKRDFDGVNWLRYHASGLQRSCKIILMWANLFYR
jgi:hypothetical protein